jgi:CheY-like chemotaxis protein
VVLAIDDDPEVIGLLRDSLGPAGFHVVGALNGQRGIELARLVHPFAITLDIMMPDKDGWQVLKEIKAEPDLCDIPVIIMSIVSERALGFSLGVTDYLVKPVDRSVLLGVLDRLRRAPALRTAVVVEDDPDAQALMGDLLASLNFEVLAASDGTEAIAMLAKEPPAFLFLSLTLPSQDVSDILAAMSADPRLERTRTVILAQHTTAAEQLEWIRRATSAVVLRSTGRPDELLRQLRALLADLTPSTASHGE